MTRLSLFRIASAVLLVLTAPASAQITSDRSAVPSRKFALGVPRRHTLARLRLDELARLDFQSTPPRIGVHRPVAAQALAQGEWETLPNGQQVWRLELASPEAAGVRVHFTDFDAGSGKVWLHDGLGQVEGPYTGRGVFDDGDFWSGIVFSSSAVIEYEPAQGALPEKIPFRISAISHQARKSDAEQVRRALDLPNPFQPEAGSSDPADSCHLDPQCFPEWGDSYKSVAEIIFESPEGYTEACSGVLLATRDKSSKPYFLTANHCINEESAARSIAAYWSYQTDKCGGAAPGTRGAAVLGAHLLFHASMDQFDAAFLQMTQVPAGAVFANWDIQDPAVGSTVAGIHHPMASWKRFSLGTRTADQTVQVEDVLAPGEGYLQVNWDKGRTQPGSSGSPLFSGPGVVVGTLSYGLMLSDGTVCTIPGLAGYGRFSKLYPYVLTYLEDLPDARVTAPTSQVVFTGRNGIIDGQSFQTFPLRTSSVSPVVYSVSSDAVWLNVSAIAGTVSAGAPGTLRIAIDPRTLTRPGTYAGRVTIYSGLADPQIVLVQVKMVWDQSNVVATVAPNPVAAQLVNGSPVWSFALKLNETAGVATRITRLLVNGTDYSGAIVAWFGTDRLGEYGSLTLDLKVRGLISATDQYFQLVGRDELTGKVWSKNVTARLLAAPAN